MNETRENIIEISGMNVFFNILEGTVHAVEGMDLKVKRNKVLGVVGETGSGKSITARAVMCAVPKPGVVTGKVLYYPAEGPDSRDGIDMGKLAMDSEKARSIRGNDITLIVQEPATSFSPLHTVGSQVMEPLLVHKGMGKKEAREAAIEMLARTGFPQPAKRFDEYSWQLSGGLNQRAMIAMALVTHPRILIADEPTTALDVTIQAQILDLMEEIQAEFGMTVLLITHHLATVSEMADEVAIMYLGEVVETAPVAEVFSRPLHPYTTDLIRSIPEIGRKGRLEVIKGIPPMLLRTPSGCRFAARCTRCIAKKCETQIPPMVQAGPDHQVRCWLYGEGNTSGGKNGNG